MKYTMKKDYTKPRLSLLTPNKTVLTTLTDRTHLSAYNIEVKEHVNEVNGLTFSIPFDNNKINNDSCENLVKLGFEHYIIKDVATSDSDTISKTVTCVHEAHEIKGIMCSSINQIGVTAQAMFNAIKSSASIPLANYIWKGTDISDATMRSLIVEGEKSVFENLLTMAELFQGWIEFSTNVYGEIQVYLRKNTIKRGKYVKKGQDLKQLNITYNTNEIFTKLTPLGAKDSVGQELNILAVNPTGKSYVENYDYYLAKGMTLEQIKATPKCQQEKIMRENDITDANELLRVAQEELGRCSVPKLEGSIDMADISVFEESAKLPPILGEEIIVIDKDINFRMSATIVGITRNYDNPLLTKVEISNVIKYDSIIKDLVHSAEVVDRVIGTDNNGSPYVVASHVQGEIDAVKTSFKCMLDSIDSPENKLAILFESRVPDRNFGGLAIGSAGLMISNELGLDGQWVWKTLANGNGYYADMVVGKLIKADLIKTGILSSFNNKSWISMDDGTFNLADKLTFNGREFIFKLNSGNTVEDEIANATDKVVFDFTSSACYNILKNSAFANKETYGWDMYRFYKYTLNPATFTPNKGSIALALDSNTYGYFYQGLGNQIKRNTVYTFSATTWWEFNISSMNMAIEYFNGGTYVGEDVISLANGGGRKSYTFTTKDIAFTNTEFRIYAYNPTSASGNIVSVIDKPCLCEGEIAVWSPNPSEIIDGNTQIDANGVTITNGALTIKNKASETVLTGDANGNLTMNGVFKTYDNGNQALELNKTQMLFYDWEGSTRTAPVGRIKSTRWDGDINKIGLSISNDENSVLALSYYKNSTFYPYIIFDEANLFGNNCAINFQRHFAMKEYQIFLGDNNANRIYASSLRKTVFQFPEGSGSGFMFQTPSSVKFAYSEGETYPLASYVNFVVTKDFSVTGSKNSLQKTKNYGERLINAYETAEYYFGDIGSGKIVNGECTVYVDEILQECVNMEMQYHVFTQVYNGKITSIERYKNYFIVKGEENTEFSWELKAKRLGYEYARLESPSNNDSNIVNLDETLNEGTKEVSEANTLIENDLNYNLTDLLLS